MAVLTGTHNLCLGQKYQNFYRKIFIFWWYFFFFFFLNYLNSYVFVMLVKFVVGRINGIFDGVETETKNSSIKSNARLFGE